MSDRRLSSDRVLLAVLALTALGLIARLALLGSRVAHFDEARVAYWTLHFLETGQFHYRSIIHGPFVQHVGRILFGLFGPTDFAARLPVALVGGFLPLVALWLRHRLSEVETVAVAFFLAINPILLYFGRFMRSTVLVASFCLVAFVAFVRWYDGYGTRYLYTGVGMLALGFTAKENALLYVLCWLGAAALIIDHKILVHRGHDSSLDWIHAQVSRVSGRVKRASTRTKQLTAGHAVGVTLLFGLIILYFYAPRGGVANASDLGLNAGNPSYDAIVARCEQASLFGSSPTVTLECTGRTIADGFEYWLTGSGDRTMESILEQLGLSAKALWFYSAPLFVLSVFGFAVERYDSTQPRQVVLGCSYWGFVSIVGYAIGTDIANTWILVNALVALAVPAAVGLAVIVAAGEDAFVRDDNVSLAAVGVLLLIVVGGTVGGAASGVYTNTTSPNNELVQFAQPSQDMRPALTDALAAAQSNDGTDVLVYGGGNENFVDGQTSSVRDPSCLSWFDTLPLGWYLTANDVETECANGISEVSDSPPPVVIVPGDCTLEDTVACREQSSAIEPPAEIESRVEGYERYAFLHRTTGGNNFDGMIFYVRE